MAVRNFWVDVYIDGRKARLEGGPRGKDGGMLVTIYQRHNGSSMKALEVYCTEENGILVTQAEATAYAPIKIRSTR